MRNTATTRHYTPLTAEELFKRLEHIRVTPSVCQFSLKKCEELVPLINRINALKVEQDTVILAHSYVAPEILYGVADYMGDSYKLSKNAMESTASNIIFAAVKFMGETAKVINPHKRVFIPSANNGCSLADAISEADVVVLRKKYPEHAFVCYINTTAEVKAHCDVCVTSSNVYDIVEDYPNDKIYFLPDRLMGENLINEMRRRGVAKEILTYDGNCYVHKNYDPEIIDQIRLEYADVDVVVHPECDEKVLEKSDYVGSTEQIMTHVKESNKPNFLVLTECGLIDRLKQEAPDKHMVGSCMMCKYMKSNSLQGILDTLENPEQAIEILLSAEVISAAKRSIDNMFRYTRG